MNTIRRKNPKLQGQIGVADAVAWLTHQDYLVSIPLMDSQKYDLIADDGRRLWRVQVKTTTRLSPHGRFLVQLDTHGGNQSFHTTSPFDPTGSDLLYVLTDDLDRYLIPTSVIDAKRAISLGDKWKPYLQTSPELRLAL